MDNIDSTIIGMLSNDSRTPFLKIASQLKVSEGTIRKRVKKLLKAGTIRRFTIETSQQRFGIVGIETETKVETKRIVQKIQSFGVPEIYEVTGKFDIICMVPALEMIMVNEILEKIRTTPGVMHTETFTILTKV
ncbi:Lrp/AsnC family transcriptional regulator [Candidatus Woesearchaeota archaeon]|nr:Lrp/AsnC family transcriptional regulator [Candidatus Woesearchaeota archaeon]